MKKPTKEELRQALAVRLNDPFAPSIFANAYASLERLGHLMANITNADKSSAYAMKIIDVKEDIGDKDFIIALTGVLCTALIAYINQGIPDGK